jgi:hypothetical protein
MKFFRRLSIGLIALAFASGAHAADMAIKVAPRAIPFTQPVCTITLCNTWFVGLGLGGLGSNLDILGSGFDNSVFANGGIPFATVGGQLWANSLFLGFEASAGGIIGTPATVNGASVNTSGGVGWAFFEVGGNLGTLFGSQQPVAVNNALVADLITPYVLTGPILPFGNSSLGTQVLWANGAGVRYLLPLQTVTAMLDVKYAYANNQSTSGLASNKSAQLVMASVLFPFKP